MACLSDDHVTANGKSVRRVELNGVVYIFKKFHPAAVQWLGEIVFTQRKTFRVHFFRPITESMEGLRYVHDIIANPEGDASPRPHDPNKSRLITDNDDPTEQFLRENGELTS